MNPGEYANLDAAEQRMWWFRGMRSILYRLVDDAVRGREVRSVLEAGCGTGLLARQLQRRYGWTLTPMDLSADGLAVARRNGGLRLVQADTLQLPFGRACFDALITLDMLVHLLPGEELRAMDEFARVLRPGGLLILRAAAFHALRSRHSQYVGERQRFNLPQLKSAVQASGFRVLRATYANTLLLPVALVRFRLWEPLTGAPVHSGVRLGPGWLEALLYSVLAAEAAWLGAGMNLPAGQTAILLAEKL